LKLNRNFLFELNLESQGWFQTVHCGALAIALCVSEVAFPAAAIEYAAKAERDAEASANIERAAAAHRV